MARSRSIGAIAGSASTEQLLVDIGAGRKIATIIAKKLARLMAEQGYPMRLLLPGYQGNMSVKWLRRLKVTNEPTHTKDETSKYSNLLPDGRPQGRQGDGRG